MTAASLLLDLTASGALHLVGAAQRTIDDVPPGEKYLIGGGQPRELSLRGYAYDESGVEEIQIELSAPGGVTETVLCPDAQPHDGRWACPWDASGLDDGTEIEFRLRAVDRFDQTSGWSAWQPLRIDDAPPMVTLDVAATGVASGSLVQESAFTLVGDVTDDGGVDDVQVCVNSTLVEEGGCAPATLKPENGLPVVTVADVPTETIAIDTQVTCGVAEITRTFWISERFAVGQVSLDFSAAHDRRDDLVVVLESPAGTQVQVLGDDGITETDYRNVAVSLDDAAPAGLFDARGDDTLALLYRRPARPYDPLRTFRGEDAAGAWTLHICDADPDEHDGAYQRGRLALTPRHGAATVGRWTYQASVGDTPMDYVSRTFTISAGDVVGNRSRDPETGTLIWDHTRQLSVWVDNVAPVITMTGTLTRPVTLTEVELGETTTILSGTVSDGGPTTEVFVHVQTPAGETHKRQVAREGERWWIDLRPLINGSYTLWVNARDLAGNVTSVGPFEMTTLRTVYLPLVLNNFSSERQSRVYLPLMLKER